MDQTTKAKCCSCKEILHIRIMEKDYRTPSMVFKIVPCPYCHSQCQLKLYEHQVPSVTVYRDAAKDSRQATVPWGKLLPPGALVDHVFPTSPASVSLEDPQ